MENIFTCSKFKRLCKYFARTHPRHRGYSSKLLLCYIIFYKSSISRKYTRYFHRFGRKYLFFTFHVQFYYKPFCHTHGILNQTIIFQPPSKMLQSSSISRGTDRLIEHTHCINCDETSILFYNISILAKVLYITFRETIAICKHRNNLNHEDRYHLSSV